MLLFLILSAVISTGKVFINEIMYNPLGNDYDFEYLELYGEQENISGWYFEGIDFVFAENTTIDGYLVLANTLLDGAGNFHERYPDCPCKDEYNGTLSNDGETIILRDSDGNIVDLVTYYDWAPENYSLERIDPEGYSSDPANWQKNLGGSPGRANSILSSCDWKLEAVVNNLTGKDIEWQIRAQKIKGKEKASMTIEHWIEDSFGNRIKDYSDIIVENASEKKTSSKYSPNMEKGFAYFINANITAISCNDSDPENDHIEKLIYFTLPQTSMQNSSNIQISKITPDAPGFGDTVKIYLEAYRGQTNKYALYTYVKDAFEKTITEKTIVHLKKKYTNYSLTLPIKLPEDCDDSKSAYFIVAEGLDTLTEKKIEIGCLISSHSKKAKKERGKISYEIAELPFTVYLNKSFDVKLKIKNSYDEEVDLEVWSYVYRGPKRYSSEKENLVYVTIDAEDDATLSLPNVVSEAEQGDYKFKVKIRKKGRITTYDKTKDIFISVPKEAAIKNLEFSQKLTIPENPVAAKTVYRYETIYESDDFRIKKLIPFFLMVLFLFAVGFSIMKIDAKDF